MPNSLKSHITELRKRVEASESFSAFLGLSIIVLVVFIAVGMAIGVPPMTTQPPAQDLSKQVSQQDVSDAAIADTLDQIAQSINTSALDDVIAVLRARELSVSETLQQPVAYLLDSEDPRDRAASTCNTVAETWREAGFTVVELTRISQ